MPSPGDTFRGRLHLQPAIRLLCQIAPPPLHAAAFRRHGRVPMLLLLLSTAVAIATTVLSGLPMSFNPSMEWLLTQQAIVTLLAATMLAPGLSGTFQRFHARARLADEAGQPRP